MSTQILMPALSPPMTEGKLARWLIKVGDDVKAGDVIAEIETDKATMEVEAVDEGVVSQILVPEGTEGVKVNTLIAQLGGAAAGTAPAPPAAAPAAGRPRPPPPPLGPRPPPPRPPGPKPRRPPPHPLPPPWPTIRK